MSTLPEAVVTNQRSVTGGLNSQIVIDPINPNHLVMVTETSGFFSINGGSSWTGITTNANLPDPNTGGAYGTASNFSAAIDRNQVLYLTYLERDAANASGALVMQKYDFAGNTPTRFAMRAFGALVGSGGSGYAIGDVLTVSGGSFTTAARLQVTNVTTSAPVGVIRGITIIEPGTYSTTPNNAVSVTGGSGSGATFNLSYATSVLERWMNADPILNPVVAVDNNLPTFVDPVSGATQTDTMSGKAVYVAWNTNNTQPITTPTASFVNPSVIKASASSDGGLSFTPPQFVSDGQNLAGVSLPATRYSTPKIVFTQGSSDGRVTGGQLVFVWDQFAASNNIIYDASQPDGGNIASKAASGQVFTGTVGAIIDASTRVNTATVVAPATVPGTNSGYSLNQNLTVNDGNEGVPESLPNPAANRAILTVSEVGLTSITSITNGGSGYVPGDVLNVSGGTSTAVATITVNRVQLPATTVVPIIPVGAAGTGYVAGATVQTVNVQGGTFTTQAQVSLLFGVTTVAVSALGSNYTVGDVLTLQAGGSITNATVTVTSINATGGVTGVNITNAGAYPTLPGTLTVTGGTGTGATIQVVAANNVVGARTVTPGVYTVIPANPAATAPSGAGSGATLNIPWAINLASVNAVGSYSVLPPNPAGVTGGSGAGAQFSLSLTEVTRVNVAAANRGNYIVPPTNPVTAIPIGTTTPGAQFTLTYGPVVPPTTPNFSDTSRTVTFTNTVSITDPTFSVNDLDVEIGIIHPRLEQLSVTLISPTGITVNLVRNRIDSFGRTVDQAGNPAPPSTNPVAGLPNVANLGAQGNVLGKTVFDQQAARLITDTGATAPYIAHFRPEGGGASSTLSAFNGLPLTSINGSWTLQITDFRNDGQTLKANIPIAQVQHFGLRFSSYISTSGFGTDRTVSGASGVATGAATAPFPSGNTASPVANGGISPGISVAIDNTLGGFSPYQGRLYISYTNGSDVFLIAGDSLKPSGATWRSAVQVNDDSASDNFSEGNRLQFLPTVAVDQVTGTVGYMYYDTRWDPSQVRSTTSFSTSIDGGRTWSPSVFLNSPKTAIDAITGDVITIEPIPGNMPQAGASGFGAQNGLAMYGGRVTPVFATNLNVAGVGNRTATVSIAAGPRVVYGDMGPIVSSTSSSGAINNTFTSDGTRQFKSFVVRFDRPIDPTSFTGDDVRVQYRNTVTAAGSPPNLTVTGAANITVTPLDAGAFNSGASGSFFAPGLPAGNPLASSFLVTLVTPLSGVGTYSYAIGPNVRDAIRDLSGNPDSGNRMDQNQNTVTNETRDAFAVPTPVSGLIQSLATSNRLDAISNVAKAANGTPFNLPYDPLTQPLILPGPYVVSTTVPNNPVTNDNLVLNNTNNALDVRFDRDILTSTFTPASLLQLISPAGAIPLPVGSVTVTPLDPATGLPNAALAAARSFRVTFPPQALSGTYRMVFSPIMKDLAGNSVDTNQNAGLDVLRGSSASPGTVTMQFNASAIPVTLTPGAVVTAPLSVDDAFLIQQSSSQHIQLRLKISHQNIPDLEAQLVAPDGTTVQLFNNVGNLGSVPHANMNDTLLDDFASVPIQSAGTPIGTGPFNPQLPLSILNSHGSQGTWTLQITNHGSLSGTLDRWSLFLPKATPSSGLGEPIADRFTPDFRIFTQDPANAITTNAWTAVGPAAQNNGTNSGRIGGLAFDPSDPSGNTVFVAGASGGVWKTTNFLTTETGGPTYTPLTDFGPGFSLNIGSIDVFPRGNDPDQSIVFVATGEGDTGTPGVGFLRSMNGGRTWQVLDSFNNVDAASPADPSDPDKIARMSSSVRLHQFVGSTAFKVVVDPTPLPNGQVAVYAALSTGVFRSLDTGKTWTLVRAGNATDVVLSAGSTNTAGNRDKLFAAFRNDGVYFTPSALTATSMSQMLGGQGMTLRRDFDTGSTSPVPVNNLSTPNGASGRILLAAPAVTNSPLENNFYQGWLYALVVSAGGTMQGLYQTKDFGGNWTKIRLPYNPLTTNPTNNESMGDYDPLGTQGNYDVSFAIDPNNPNIVYIHGTRVATVYGGIRVDTTTVSDAYSLIAYDNSDNDSGTLQLASNGPVAIKPASPGPPPVGPGLPYGILAPSSNSITTSRPGTGGGYFNLLRDPDNPFTTPSTFQYHNVLRFNNGGDDSRWMPFDSNAMVGFSSNHHELVAYKDPVTGFTRLIFGDDQGVFTAMDRGDGTLIQSIGTRQFPQGQRNGNLQIIMFVAGAAQPSTLAADIADAMFYGNANNNGYPISDANLLHNGNLNWNGQIGDGGGIATDPTGSGTYYTYRWPFNSRPLESDFFLVQEPSVGTLISRTGGPGASIIQPGDNPASGAGQWPLTNAGNFAVNPIDKNGLLISALQAKVAPSTGPAGTIYRSTDMGKNWFIIGTTATGDLDGSYAPALAFGSPRTNAPGANNDFIYAGTSAGNVFVTFTGGGVGRWTNIRFNLTGNPLVIVPSPTRDSNEVYVVTTTGVWWMGDSSVSTSWVQLNETANGRGPLLSGFLQPVFGNNNDQAQILKNLQSMAVDWRWAIPDNSGFITNATNANPIVITTNVAHGLQTGAQVNITGVLGNTNANGTFTVTVTSATTFSLNGIAGNGAYTGGGTWSVVSSGAVTGATTAGPIVITTATNHGLVTGNSVAISGVQGINANGNFTVTVLSNTTFSLNGSTGVGNYTAGTGVWKNTSSHPVVYVSGEGGVYRSIDKGLSWTAFPNGTNEQQTITIPATVTSLTMSYNGATAPSAAISDATNTSPIIITSAGHPLATGDIVTISGANGNTNANGTYTITVLGPNTFQLNGSTGNGSYVGGGVWTKTLAFSPSTTPAQFQAYLNSITGLANNVSVAGVNGGPYVVTFINALAKTDINHLVVANAVPSANNITVVETMRGVSVGGYLPANRINDLDLVLGDINPTTGFPDESAGLDMLVATTYGRGMFAIRMDNSPYAQYAVTPRFGPRITSAVADTGSNGIGLTFSSSVDYASVSSADVTQMEIQKITVTAPVTSLTVTYNGVAATSPLAYSAATTAAQVQDHLETIPALLTNEQQKVVIPGNITSVSFSFNGVTAPSGTITNASNAGPIVITSAGHGLTTGATVAISGVVGNSAANGTWTITVLTPDTFSLNSSSGNGNYASGGVWIRALAFSPATTFAQLQAHLNTIPNLTGNVSVSGAPGGPYLVTFINGLRGRDVPFLAANNVGVAVMEPVKGGPNFRVAGAPGGPYFITYVHKLAGQDTSLVTATFVGAGSVSIVEQLKGSTLGMLDPNGNPISVRSVVETSSSPDHDLFRINLPTPPTPAPGFYSFVFGPTVSDYSGNRMDQDQDFVSGEISDDMYIGRVLFQNFTNSRPSLGVSTPALPAIAEDAFTNGGVDLATWLASLPAGAIADPNDASYSPGTAPRGIAVTGVNNSNGQWQYATDAFSSNPFWFSFGAPTAATARLLEVSGSTRIRFVPNPNFNSTFPGSAVQFTFKAWDLTAGVAGDTLDTTPTGSGSSSYSTATATAILTVTAVNDAPVNTVPGAQSTIEDTARVFSSANGNRISIADIDDADNAITGDELIQVTLSAPNATITLSGIAGLSFSFSDANGTGAGTGAGNTTMTFRGSLANVNAALNGLSVLPNLNFVGSTTLTMTTNDLGNFGAVGPLTDVDTVAITVSAVNDAPVNTVPSTQTTPEDIDLLFSTANLNRISIGDVDDADNGVTGDELIQVRLTAVNGLLTLASITNLNFAFSDANGAGAGDGVTDLTMTFRGTLNDVNLALDGLRFIPTPNFSGAASVTIVSNDLGNFGTGLPLTDTDVVNIDVTPVNDVPVNTVPATQTTVEETARVFSTSNANLISVGDVDDADNGLAGDETVQVTLTALKGTLTLGGVTGLTFSFSDANGVGAGDGAADATMTFRGTLTDVNSALNGLSFLPNLNVTGSTSVTILTNDLGNFGAGVPLTDSDTVTINVTAVNDAPINATPGTQTTPEDTPLVFSPANLNSILASDVDDADNAITGDETVQVTLTAVQGRLTLSAMTGLIFTFSDANGVGAGDGIDDTTMTFRGTLADVNAALNGLSFGPNSNVVGAATLTVTTKDLGNFGTGGNLTDVDVVNINITPVNDTPVNTAPLTQTVNEDTPLVFSASNGNRISVADVDDADNAVTGDEVIQVSLTATNGVLTLGSTTGLSFSFTDANGTGLGDGIADVAMTFRGTVTDVNAALNGLTFASPLNYNGAASVTIVSNDLGNFGAGLPLTDSDTVLITIAPVNDLPRNTTPASATTVEETPLVFSTGNGNRISVGDVDDADNNVAGDEPVQVRLASSEGTITLNGTSGLSFVFGDGVADNDMTFVGTIANVNAALDGLTFTPNLNFTNTATLTITTFDLNNYGSGASTPVATPIPIIVTPVNDAPTISVPGPQTVNEDTPIVFSAANSNAISIADIDDVADGVTGNLQVQVTLTGTNGAISLSTISGLSFSFSDANGTGAGTGTGNTTMTFRGTLNDVNAALNGLTFRSAANYVGSAGLNIGTNDLGNLGAGSPLTDSKSIALAFLPVNDAPVNNVPPAQSTPEESVKVFSTGNGNRIFIGDVDDADNSTSGDEPVQVTLSVTNGVLTLGAFTGINFSFSDANGTAAGDGIADTTMTFRGTLGNVNAALNGLAFVPNVNFVGTALLTIVSNDLGNFGAGGSLTDTDTVSINVSPVNDAPVNTVPGLQSAVEDTALFLSGANRVSVADVDDGDNGIAGDQIVQVTLTTTNGVLTLNTTTGLSFAFSDANGTGAGDGATDAVMTFRGPLTRVNASLDFMRFNPNPNFVGGAAVAISTNDLGTSGPGAPLTDSDSVAIVVNAVNDAPENTVPAAQNVLEDFALVFTTANANRISVGDVDDADNGITGDELIQVTLTATNGVLTLNGTLGLTFSFADTNGSGAGDGTDDSTMTFRGSLTNINAALHGLIFQAPLDYFGAASVSITSNDLGNFGLGSPLIDSDTVAIIVAPVNDAPSFNLPINPPTIGQGAGAQTVPGFTTLMSAGPSNESTQTLAFNVTQIASSGGISFLAAPAIDPLTGTLTYQPTPTAFGNATFSVVLTDSGPGSPAPNVNSSTAQTFTITILLPSTVTLTPTPANPQHGQSSSLSIAVTGSPVGPPTGTVDISDTFNGNTSVVQSNVPLVGGVASINLGLLPTGVHSLHVTYSGDGAFAPSDRTISYTVSPASTSTTLSSTTADPSVVGNAVNFAAVVAVTSGGTPSTITGSVEFRLGGAFLSTVTTPSSITPTTATYLFSYAGLGVNPTVGHLITAVYRGSNPAAPSTQDFAASPTSNVLIRKVVAATTAISTPVASPSQSFYGQTVTFTADVTSTNSPLTPNIGTVTFFRGATILSTVPVNGAGRATFTTQGTALSIGTHTITAKYNGSTIFASGITSSPLTHEVKKAATQVAVTSSLPAGSFYRQSVKFTATVSIFSSGTPGVLAGSVTFWDGPVGTGINLGTVTLVNGVATKSLSTLRANANHNINAVYNGNATFASSSGVINNYHVAPATTTTTLTSSSTYWPLNQAITFTAAVKATSPGSPGIPVGTVTFVIDGVNQTTPIALVSGKASRSVKFTTAGTHTMSVIYNPTLSPNQNFAVSSAPLQTQNVRKAPTMTLSSSLASGALVNETVKFTVKLSGSGGIPSGTVQFFDNGVLLATVNVNSSGVAVFSISTLKLGTHTISAVYSGDGSFNPAKRNLSQAILLTRPSRLV